MRIKRIPSSEVPLQLVKTARTAARDAAFDLGLGEMQIVWFRPYPGEKTAGYFDERWPNVVHLSADWAERNGPAQLRGAIFHECRHAWQFKTMRYYGHGYKRQSEDDANGYSYRKTGTLLNIELYDLI